MHVSGGMVLRFTVLSLALVASLALSACGSSDAAEQPSSTTITTAPTTTTTAPTTTTTAPTTTTTAPTTTTTAPTTTTTAPPEATAEMLVTWDGTTCTYEGPESVTTGTLAEVTYHNEGDVPGDLEIDYLSGGVTLEQILAAWPDEIRGGEGIPTDTNMVAGIPEYPNSAAPGVSVIANVTFNIPRLHTFICWGGGTSSALQTVDVAPAALTVTDG